MKEIMEEYGGVLLTAGAALAVIGFLFGQIGSNGVFRAMLSYWCSNLC